MTRYVILTILTIISCNNKSTMKDNAIQIDSFKIIGISVRTTNENGQSMIDMGELWSRLYADKIISKIPDRISDDIYAIYTDYASNYKGAYTAIIGCKVKSLDKIPNGMTGKIIQGGKFLCYNEKGKLPDVVVARWKEIWNNDSLLNRKYAADFEVYNQEHSTPENTEVDILISIN